MRNEYFRGTVKVVEASKKVQGSRMRWYEHVMRRNDEYVGRAHTRILTQESIFRGCSLLKYLITAKAHMPG